MYVYLKYIGEGQKINQKFLIILVYEYNWIYLFIYL